MDDGYVWFNSLFLWPPFIQPALRVFSSAPYLSEYKKARNKILYYLFFLYLLFFPYSSQNYCNVKKKKKDDRLWYRGSFKMGTLGSILNPELGVFGPDDKKKIALV